eukprot:1766627-Lingulodinium_polyedra.AAC.1
MSRLEMSDPGTPASGAECKAPAARAGPRCPAPKQPCPGRGGRSGETRQQRPLRRHRCGP